MPRPHQVTSAWCSRLPKKAPPPLQPSNLSVPLREERGCITNQVDMNCHENNRLLTVLKKGATEQQREREPQELEVCFGGSAQGATSTGFPPPWPGLEMNLLGPTFSAETQHGAAADPTVPPLPEEDEEGAAEPEDPFHGALDISRVNLAKMPAPAGCRQRRRGRIGSRSGSGRGPT